MLGRLRDAIRTDAAAEVASGRLILWLPVLLGCGILLYFGAEQEPSLPAALGLAGVMACVAFAARTRPRACAVLLGLATLAAGFALAAVHTASIARPVIITPPTPVRLTGFIEQVERRATADRVLLRVTSAEGRGLEVVPKLVRISLGRGTAPAAGTPVEMLVRLLPPMEAALPGGYDFGRNIWFRGIDAVGFGLGRPKLIAAPGEPPFSVRFGAAIEQVRQSVGTRIRQSLEGTAAAIAVALVVGDRTAISPQVEESMRVSGLTHVLSISGLHMAMVAGTLFFLVRGLLAAFPPLALGAPIKSMAALAALAGSGIYLLLSGNDWPAQRSFFMLAIVLVGVLAGRAALTLRTVAVAAVLVLVLGPEAILEPGTQMSFAATLALVAAFEHWSRVRGRPMVGSLMWRALARGLMFLAALSLTSLVAGTATAPYAALHFQRLGLYGLLANLAAMPAVEFLVMPFGLLGVLLMPFGWDFIAWPVMGLGIDLMVKVSDLVAALPGADARTDWVGPAAAGVLTLALLCPCLLRGWLRALAVIPAVVALLLMGPPPRPDVLIAPNGQTVAVRGADGRLSVAGAGSGRLMVEQWLSREADVRKADAPDLDLGFLCDARGCRISLRGGGHLTLLRRADGLPAACGAGDIVVAPWPPPPDCAAKAFYPEALARTGTLAMYRRPDSKSVPAGGKPGPMGRAEDVETHQPDLADPIPPAVPDERSGRGAAMAGTADSSPPEPPPLTGRPRRMAADHRASLRREGAAREPVVTLAAEVDGAVRQGKVEEWLGTGSGQVVGPAAPLASADRTPELSGGPRSGQTGGRPGGRGNTSTEAAIAPGREPPFTSLWRVVPTRAPGVQRPWMPVLPPLAEKQDEPERAGIRAAEDALTAP
ncbi:ComEC/Rec2 family competence protein [Azorhizobium oxalatiphilum]|uniref:ComEC/Rec2 family competence protein n=1 Tax=Azorhizobium oxalatiphilum TaxID=980631 RepID=UPI001665ADC8|nr:ComEC/Rec2 family competence protein [Azorhizobium oxalatiphilum]